MHSLVNDYPDKLLRTEHSTPCVSIYLPTHRAYPDRQQDSIRFRNLARRAEELLERDYSRADRDAVMKEVRALEEDSQLWHNTLDGLAVLATPDFFRLYRLQRPVPERVVVADSLHCKPLVRVIQSADNYQLLGLDRQEVKLFEGNRYAIDQVPLSPEVPATITDALGEELTEPMRKPASHGGPAGAGVQHGQGSRKDEQDVDTERFFRVIDKAVSEHHSQQSRLPLLLASLPEYHGIFHEISHNPWLLSESIPVHPDGVSLEELRRRAWEVLEPRYLERTAELREQFGNARARSEATHDLAGAARAAVSGRIATLLIDAAIYRY